MGYKKLQLSNQYPMMVARIKEVTMYLNANIKKR
jgi:hypothetical protein